jgi:hypothetical protein
LPSSSQYIMQTSNVSCCVRSSTEFLLVCSFDATDMNDTILTLSMYEHLNKDVLREFLKMSASKYESQFWLKLPVA